MKNLDINVIEILKDGSYKLYDMWSKTTEDPIHDTALSGTFDLVNTKYEKTNDKGVIYFERKLDTGDKYDNKIVVVMFIFTIGN
jgi:hypothetical protein